MEFKEFKKYICQRNVAELLGCSVKVVKKNGKICFGEINKVDPKLFYIKDVSFTYKDVSQIFVISDKFEDIFKEELASIEKTYKAMIADATNKANIYKNDSIEILKKKHDESKLSFQRHTPGSYSFTSKCIVYMLNNNNEFDMVKFEGVNNERNRFFVDNNGKLLKTTELYTNRL